MFYALSMPWGLSQYYKDKFDLKNHGQGLLVYKGALLPAELRPFASKDFSWERWQEDEKNATVLPPEKSSVQFKPRPHQVEAAKKIRESFTKGLPGFLLADKTGLGKTLEIIVGITAIAKEEGYNGRSRAKLLIVCPKGVIPVWRQTLHNYSVASAFSRVLIINYQQLNKLLQAPPEIRTARKKSTKNRLTARKGKPTIDWDFIVFDEAHYLKNYPKSATSMAAASLAQLNSGYVKGRSPFVIYSTATPGSSPLNFAMMSNFLAPLITKNPKDSISPTLWGAFLAKQGFDITKTKSGYNWAAIPWYGKNATGVREKAKYEASVKKAKMNQRRDAQRIGRALITQGAPFIMRSPKDIAGWPEQQFIPLPLQMEGKQFAIYEEAWTRFRNWLNLTPARKDPKGALVENLRYRQKSSLLKVDSMIENVMDYIEAENQVFISVEFMETLDSYKEKLEKKNIPVSEISGRNVKEREDERIKFQKGMTKVVLCSVVEGISLHSNETLPDGTKATATPRISILHDIRQNPLSTIQAAGRAHRSGENSITYIPYLEGTVDKKVIDSFVNKQANMKTMIGTPEAEAEEMELLFRQAAAKTQKR